MADKAEDTKRAEEQSPGGDRQERTEARPDAASQNKALTPAWDKSVNAVVMNGRRQAAQGLPEIAIVESVEKNGKAAPVQDSNTSWANRDLASAMKYLDSVKTRADAVIKAPANSGGERAQFNVYEQLGKTLQELQREGAIGKEWKLYPSMPNSPADKVGADYLLVNSQTGETHFLDATTNPDKRNVFSLRSKGVFLVNNALFDQWGSLKIDEDKNLDVRNDAIKLQAEMKAQVLDLVKSGSAFRIGQNGTPIPSLEVKSDDQVKREVSALSDWAKSQADKQPKLASSFRDMADVVMRSFRQAEAKQIEVVSPALTKSVKNLTEQEVARYVYTRYKGEQYQGPSDGKVRPNSDIYTLAGKDGMPIKMKTSDGQLLDGGMLSQHLKDARVALVNTPKLLSLLTNKQLQAMGADVSSFKDKGGQERIDAIDKAMRTQSKFKAEAEKLRSVFGDSYTRGTIENGGLNGNGKAILAGNIIERLRQRSEDTVLDRTPAKQEKAAANVAAQPEAAKGPERTIPASAASELFELRTSKHNLDTKVADSDVALSLGLMLEEQEGKAKNGESSWNEKQLQNFRELSQAYDDPSNPKHAEAVKEVNSSLNAAREDRMAQLNVRGNANLEKLSDQNKMAAALKELAERASQRMPEGLQERSDFVAAQLKTAMRKQFGVATDRELPEAVRGLKVQFTNARETKVVQDPTSKSAVVQIPMNMMKENLKGALADAYGRVAGLALIDATVDKANLEVAMRSLRPMTDEFAKRALTVIEGRSEQIAQAQSSRPAEGGKAESDRGVVIDLNKPLVTAWDGENLTFGQEKFHLKSEIERAAKQTSERVKNIEAEFEKAKQLAESQKTDAAKQQVAFLQSQLDAERQNLRMISELHEAANGARGEHAQQRVQELARSAAERTLQDLSRRPRMNGFGLGRAAAAMLVVTTLAGMMVNSDAKASEPSRYEHSYR